MIDFRYHIVSIVSIFLALAVGIVLGAGPLQGRLGDQLKAEVTQLRKAKTDLSGQLSDSQAGVTDRDKFLSTLTPEMVAAKLTDRSVTFVTLPGADSSIVKTSQDVVTAAGAKVNGTVKVTSAWTDPTKKAFRESLAKSLAPLTTTTLPVGASQDQELASVLARGLVVADLAAQGKPDTGATSALQGLKTGGVIDFSGDPPPPSTLIVVVAGPPTAKEAESQQNDEATSYAVLSRALDAGGAGAVAVSDETAASTGGLVHAIRVDKQASAAVSTVDDADQQMGLITEVLALREQITGDSGQYGTAPGAAKIVPTDAGL